MEKATIYDYARMCGSPNPKCDKCKLHALRRVGYICTCVLRNQTYEAYEIILNWCKEHPIKTRQDEFLKMFPNAEKLSNNVVNVNPCQVDKKIFVGLTTIDCITSKSYNCCAQCKNEYWLEEVDEDDTK